MENRVKILREQKNMTQNELAEKSGLSLRTVQRVEAGNSLKGFTLKTLALALDTRPDNLMIQVKEETDIQRAKLINLSTLFGLIVPFTDIIIPAILTYRTKDVKNRELGKSIVCIQIILAAILSIVLIISPFIQRALTLKFPLFMVVLILFLGIKLLLIIKNGISLNKKKELFIRLKTNFL